MWYYINRSQHNSRSKLIIVAQMQLEDGMMVESNSKDGTKEMIFEENKYRFQLANNVLISCSLLKA